jgi:GR25 family glycosyltransferase involved in LPS biosynthesis
VYNTFVISLANSGSGKHQQSARNILPQTLSYGQHYNWNIKVFDAVNGYKLNESIWEQYQLTCPQKSNNEKKRIGDLPGAQGCFLSHYILWNRCIELNQPIVILEDDAEVTAPLEIISTDFDLVKLHQPRADGQSKLGHWSTGAFAYWISPSGAKKLVDFSKQKGPILVDKIIVSTVLNWGYLTPPIVKLGPRIGSSTQPEKYPYRY